LHESCQFLAESYPVAREKRVHNIFIILTAAYATGNSSPRMGVRIKSDPSS